MTPATTTITPKPISDKSLKSKSLDGFRVMKILESTALQLEKLSLQANGSGPKRVQWKDIVDVSVSKITRADLEKLRNEKLTPSDRFEEMCASYLMNHPGATRETFLETLIKNTNVSSINAERKQATSEVGHG